MEENRDIIDWGAVLIAIGTLFEILPVIASLLSVVWLSLRIYETDTVQRLLGRTDKTNNN
jgi:hypothetical protein